MTDLFLYGVERFSFLYAVICRCLNLFHLAFRTSSSGADINSQAALLLRKQLAELNKSPVEGFSAGLIDDQDIFRWEVGSQPHNHVRP